MPSFEPEGLSSFGLTPLSTLGGGYTMTPPKYSQKQSLVQVGKVSHDQQQLEIGTVLDYNHDPFLYRLPTSCCKILPLANSLFILRMNIEDLNCVDKGGVIGNSGNIQIPSCRLRLATHLGMQIVAK